MQNTLPIPPLPAKSSRPANSGTELAIALPSVRERNRAELPLFERYTAHLGIVALTVVILLASSIHLDLPTVPVRSLDPNELPPMELASPENINYLTQSIDPLTSLPAAAESPDQPPVERTRNDVVKYTVVSGDSVSRIASKFGLTGDTILWANSALDDNPDLLALGQSLIIPPTNGVLVKAGQGDTAEALAKKYKALLPDVVGYDFNQSHHTFKDGQLLLTVGEFVMLPGGQKPYVPRVASVSGSVPLGAARGTSSFSWPVGACVSQYFWARHSGIDLAAPLGSPVYAADSGYVTQVGWDPVGYGNAILINHGNGYVTRYGHLSAFAVAVGQSVRKGSLIGRVGSTGNSTGPHLHFEIIYQGVYRNPSAFISSTPPACYR